MYRAHMHIVRLSVLKSTFSYIHCLCLLKFSPSHNVCNRHGTMTSADFSPFVVTHGFHTLFPSADETSPGTTHHFLSIYLPHLLWLIPSSYWTSTCWAALSLTIAWCDFCSSDQRFASTFLQIPLALITVITMKRTPLVLAISFPLLGRIRNFHPLVTCAARRTKKRLPRKTSEALNLLY